VSASSLPRFPCPASCCSPISTVIMCSPGRTPGGGGAAAIRGSGAQARRRRRQYRHRLVWAGHEVIIASHRAGRDRRLAAGAGGGIRSGLQPCGALGGETGELLVLVDSTGERTILRRPRRPDLPGDLPTEGVDCLYVNYPGTAIIGYMRQMLAKSFVVAQYPKGGRPAAPATCWWPPARSRRGERSLAACPPARRGAARMAGADRGQGGAVAIHGEEQVGWRRGRCPWWTPRGRGCLRRRPHPRSGAGMAIRMRCSARWTGAPSRSPPRVPSSQALKTG
jgi:hypothetical protein